MSVISNKFTNTSLLTKVLFPYVARLNELVSSSNLELLIKIKEYQSEINKDMIKLAKLITSWNSEDTKLLNFDEYCNLSFKLLSTTMNIDINIDKIYNIISKEINVDIESGISTTSALDISDKFEKVVQAMNNYLKNRIDVLDDFTGLITGRIFKRVLQCLDKEPAPYEIIQKYYKKDDNTILLYTKLIQIIIDYYYKNNLPDKFKPEIQLEKDKTWQLTQHSDIKYQNKDKRGGKTNNLISKWNLIPQSDFKSIGEIIYILFNISVGSHSNVEQIINRISKLAKSNINIIVITNTSPDIIEHNIDKIVGDNVQKYIISPNNGISSQSIEKFTTLQFSTAKKWDFNIKWYTSPKATNGKFYVIETFNKDTFRILSRFHTTYALDKHHVIGLLQFINNKNQIKISRVTEYNNLMDNGLYTEMISGNIIDLEQIVKESAYKIDTGPLKQKIKLELLKVFDELIKKNNPRDLPSLRDLLYNPKLENTFIDVQIDIYQSNKYFKLEKSKNKMFTQSHILDSFLNDLGNSSRVFNRELSNEFQKFIDKYEDVLMPGKYKFILENVLKSTLDITITREHNVFQNIVFKIDMLNNL